MPIASPLHLSSEESVAKIQGFEVAPPATRFRMMGVASFVLRQNGPDGMQLPVLPEQMLSTEHIW